MSRGGSALQLDDNLKNLLRELGHAINDTVSESERITGAIAGVRAHGYDIVLKLDATIGLAKRDGAAAEDAKLTTRSEEHTSELQSHVNLVCRLLLEKKKKKNKNERVRK